MSNDTIYINLRETPELSPIFKRAFPQYGGKKHEVRITSIPIRLDSYWSGGSRSKFKLVGLDENMRVKAIPQNMSGFETEVDKELEKVKVPCPGIAVVEHCFF